MTLFKDNLFLAIFHTVAWGFVSGLSWYSYFKFGRFGP